MIRSTSSVSFRDLLAIALASLLLLDAHGCGNPTTPSSDALVLFDVGGEMFRVQLTGRDRVRAAEAARVGVGPTIPNGRVVAGTEVNVGWSWHLEDVEFTEVAIEVCDGRPSDVEREGVAFGGGWYCPWLSLGCAGRIHYASLAEVVSSAPRTRVL